MESPLSIDRAEDEGDRFVPTRGQTSVASRCSRYEFEGFKSSEGTQNALKSYERHRFLYESLFDEPVKPKALFSFSGRKRPLHNDEDPATAQGPFEHDSIRLLSKSVDKESNKRAKILRRQQEIPQKPYKVLDAPNLRPDYYLHLLSWSKANVLAVALDHTVYLWQPSSVVNLMSVRKRSGTQTYVTCLSWCETDHKYLAIGSSCGKVYIYDTICCSCIRSFKEHKIESGQSPPDMPMVLTWNEGILSVGNRSGLIVLCDVFRSDKTIQAVPAHESIVCSLDWNADGRRLASGGNDNMVHIVDFRKLRGRWETLRGHNAAVKALSWCPFKSETLVTGGGTHDRCIKIWKLGELQESIPTDSQLTSFEWNPCQRELIAAAGYSGGKLLFLQFPKMEHITQVKLHNDRILFTAMSPDQNTIIAGGCGQLLAFWQVNPQRGAEALADSSCFSARPIR